MYLPFRFSSRGGFGSVLEIYIDLSPFMENIALHKRDVWLWIITGFALLYLILFGLVFDASRRIKNQHSVIIQAEKEWEETFDTITDMITVHDNEFHIIRWNRAAEKILGLSFLNTTKAKCYSYYHGKDTPPEGCPSCKCLISKQPASFETFEPHLNMFLEIRAIPRLDKDNQLTGLIHVVRDITNRKKSQEKMMLQYDRLEALHVIDTAISSNLSMNVILEIFLEQACTRLRVDAAGVLVLQPKTNVLAYVAGYGYRSYETRKKTIQLGQGCAGRAALDHRPVIIRNVAETEEEFQCDSFHKGEEFMSAYFMPLIAKGEVRGVLEIFSRTVLEPDDEWMKCLEALALQGAIAIENSTLFEDLKRNNLELLSA